MPSDRLPIFGSKRKGSTSSTHSDSSTKSINTHSLSTGRGGVGNFSGKAIELTEEDQNLPILKSPIFTSGRGGTGNMQRNDPDHPEYARSSQDVELLPGRRPSSSNNGEYHGVRGGAGNIFRPSQDELLQAAAAEREYEERVKYDRNIPVDHSRHDYRGWADKGKDLLMKRIRG